MYQVCNEYHCSNLLHLSAFPQAPWPSNCVALRCSHSCLNVIMLVITGMLGFTSMMGCSLTARFVAPQLNCKAHFLRSTWLHANLQTAQQCTISIRCGDVVHISLATWSITNHDAYIVIQTYLQCSGSSSSALFEYLPNSCPGGTVACYCICSTRLVAIMYHGMLVTVAAAVCLAFTCSMLVHILRCCAMLQHAHLHIVGGKC